MRPDSSALEIKKKSDLWLLFLFDCKNESRPSAPSVCPAILVSERLAIITLASTSLIRAAMIEPLALVVVVACTLVVALAVATGATVLIVSTKQISKEPV